MNTNLTNIKPSKKQLRNVIAHLKQQRKLMVADTAKDLKAIRNEIAELQNRFLHVVKVDIIHVSRIDQRIEELKSQL